MLSELLNQIVQGQPYQPIKMRPMMIIKGWTLCANMIGFKVVPHEKRSFILSNVKRALVLLHLQEKRIDVCDIFIWK